MTFRSAAAGALAALVFAGAASGDAPAAKAATITPCRIHLGEVRDLRSDPTTLGFLYGQSIKAGDTVQWLREALAGTASPAIVFSAPGAPADLDMEVELLKAYAFNTNMARAMTVVLRVRFSHAGAVVAEHVYRGSKTGLGFVGGDRETQAAEREVLAEAVRPVGPDVMAACRPGA